MDYEDTNIVFEKNTVFTIVGRNNQNKDYLVYYIVGKFKNYGYNFGTVMGAMYPYIKYFSDNIFIRYDNIVFHNYLEKMKEKKEKLEIKKEKMIENLLVIDTEYLNLNTREWLFFLENHKNYNTTIIFIIDKIKQPNISLLKKYTDYGYILNIKSNNSEKHLSYKNNFINACYNTFGKTLEYKTFLDFYNRTVEQDVMLLVLNKKEKGSEDSFYYQLFYKEVKEYYFNTINLYEDTEKYSNVCRIRDILKIHEE
jgi:hypothetical protein